MPGTWRGRKARADGDPVQCFRERGGVGAVGEVGEALESAEPVERANHSVSGVVGNAGFDVATKGGHSGITLSSRPSHPASPGPFAIGRCQSTEMEVSG